MSKKKNRILKREPSGMNENNIIEQESSSSNENNIIEQDSSSLNENIIDETTLDNEIKDSTYNNEDVDNTISSSEADNDMEVSSTDDYDSIKRKRRNNIISILRILFTIGFFVFAALFINEVLIQPYKLKKSIEKARNLYHYTDTASTREPYNEITDEDNIDDQSKDTYSNEVDLVLSPTPTPDPYRDDMGRLIKFSSLIQVNDDVKGWVRIDNISGENDTKIDYVVVQSDRQDPEYYLTRDWASHEYLKAGSIFLDSTSSVESNTKNLIIHGHNMTSSDDMFHYLLDYREINFLKQHPIISFDTIYEEGLWKVFSVFITPGANERDDFFPFVRSTFSSDRDYLDYIYQIRVRSLFNIDNVDFNEDDQILTLSTCSYELSNYRTVIVARKVREGEDPLVDTDSIHKNKKALYPPSFYNHYGGKAPEIPTLDEALSEGLIPWYNPSKP